MKTGSKTKGEEGKVWEGEVLQPARSYARKVNQPLMVLADSPAVHTRDRMALPADSDPSLLLHSVPHMEQEHLEGSVLINPRARKVCLKITLHCPGCA